MMLFQIWQLFQLQVTSRPTFLILIFFLLLDVDQLP
jgi:hypothetical protein